MFNQLYNQVTVISLKGESGQVRAKGARLGQIKKGEKAEVGIDYLIVNEPGF